MIGWLYRIIIGRFGCEHNWKILKPVDVQVHYEDSSPEVWIDYHLQCSKCGKVKYQSMKPKI